MKIYKYLPTHQGGKNVLREGSIKVLSEGTIKFSSRVEFNDPFDCVANIDYTQSAKNFMDTDIYTQQARANRAVSRNKGKKLLEKAEKKLTSKFKQDTFSKLIDNFGVCCFSLSEDNILMWSHYASEHRGFVVEFTVEPNKFQGEKSIVENLIGEPVTYSKDMPTITNIMSPDRDTVEPMFFTKSIDWKYEQEYRVVTMKHGIHKFDQSLISRVILGVNIEKKDEELIRKEVRGINERLGAKIVVIKAQQLKKSYKLRTE
ncbi:DUF2971 domain-containing protein [Vibrio parahaemolyticus]|nr:DUF2971 domain-containing protein [Vibrio parahaemolyticus]